MGSFGVVVLDKLLDEVVEMTGAKHDELVQALAPQCLDEPFDVSVKIG